MGRVYTKGFIAAGIALIVIIILLITMFSNSWYYWDMKHSKTEKRQDNPNYKYTDVEQAEFRFGLSEMEASGDPISLYLVDDSFYSSGESATIIRDYKELPDSRGDSEKLEDAFSLVQIIQIIGMILVFAFLALSVLAAIRLIPGWIPLLVGLVSFAVVIAGPISLIYILPDAMEESFETYIDYHDVESDSPAESFWDSKENSSSFTEEVITSRRWYITIVTTEIDDSWGPGWAWSLSVFAGFVMGGNSFFCIGIGKRKSEWDEIEDSDDEEDWEEDEESDILKRLRGKQDSLDTDVGDKRGGDEGSRESSPIRDNRVEKRCVKCEATLIDPKSVFCPYCGTDQTRKDETATPVQMNKCIDCGTPVQSPLIFCDPCVMKQTQAGIPSDPAPQPITGRYVHQQQVSNIPVAEQRYAPVPTEPAVPPFIQQVQAPLPPVDQQNYGQQQQVPPPGPMFIQQQELKPPAPPPPAATGYGDLQ